MVTFILNAFLVAIIVVLVSKNWSRIEVKRFTTALWVAILLGLAESTLGTFIHWLVGVFTLGIAKWLLIDFFVRLFITAGLIKVIDKFVGGFRVKGWSAAFGLAIAIAATSTCIGWIIDWFN